MKQLRTEYEIMRKWHGQEQPLLSIVCITFNHEKYIKDALDGFLIQDTDFPFEIILHDDASTDNTASIIRQYQAEYPNLVKPIFQTENQYRQGKKITPTVFPFCKGKYIALCEGDDYWVDKSKLQIQIDFMKQNEHCVLTFHACRYLDPVSGRYVKFHRYGNGNSYLPIEDIILGGGGLIGTQTIVLRRRVIETLPDYYFNAPAGDYPLVIHAATLGRVYYFDRSMAVYRIYAVGSAMAAVKCLSFNRHMLRYEGFADMLGRFNQLTCGKYFSVVKWKISQILFDSFRKRKNDASMRERFVQVIKYFGRLCWKPRLLALLFVLPVPGNMSELAQMQSHYFEKIKEKVKKYIRRFCPSVLIFFAQYLLVNIFRLFYYGVHSAPPPKNSTVLTDTDAPTFFGYHDKTPDNVVGDKVLAMSIPNLDTRAEVECTRIKLGYFTKNKDGKFNKVFIPFSDTTTWCWQQGCMLQWHPNKPDSQVIYNDLVDERYGSIVFDLDGLKIVRKYNEPVYTVSPDGKFATTLNFSRLGRLRPGYGYALLPDVTILEAAPENDGLFLFDLETGDKKILVSLADLAKTAGGSSAQHYVNHATFSPDVNHIVFFHLWTRVDSYERGLRVCEVDTLSGIWREIESKRVVSHYCWRDSSTFLATTLESSGQWHYTMYDLKNDTRTDLDLPLNGDGHPMFHPEDKNIIVTDTYPDKRRDQHLLVINIQTKECQKIATLYSPLKYQGQVRCDLHPRWSRMGNLVISDSAFCGRRKLLVTDYVL